MTRKTDFVRWFSELGRADTATAEDLPEASFAGQLETFLNVRGDQALLAACKGCYASLFTDRAIVYRRNHGFEHMQVALSVGVQEMVRSDRAGAGVMFSIDTESGFPGAVLLDAAWGLGETVVQGMIAPECSIVWNRRMAPQTMRMGVSAVSSPSATAACTSTGRAPKYPSRMA